MARHRDPKDESAGGGTEEATAAAPAASVAAAEANGTPPPRPKGRTTTRGLDAEIKAMAAIHAELVELEEAEPGAGQRVLDWIVGKWKRQQAAPTQE